MSAEKRDGRIRTRYWEWLAAGIILLAAAIGYLSNRPIITPHAESYYGLLTQAFTRGQVSLVVQADEAFYNLENPYAGPQDTVRPHDMSYYDGKFYLYYGATPAILLGTPWKILTGTYLTEAAQVSLFVLAGAFVTSLWLLIFRRKFLAGAGLGWVLLGITVICIGSPVFFLTNNHTFYAVPISAGYFCLCLGFVCAAEAARMKRQDNAEILIALASLALGLAVGARPIYIMSVPLVLLPAFVFWRRLAPEERKSRPAVRLAVAAIAPAAFVGAGIAAYNYARFDSPFDFGIRFSLASGDLREAVFMGWEFIPKNIRLYLLEPAEIIRFYPFLHTNGRPFGVLPHLTFVAVVLLFPFTLLRANARRSEWVIPAMFLAVSACANFAMLSLFFGGEDRYLVDFAPAALLLGAACVLWFADRGAGWPGAVRWPVLSVTAILAVWTIANGACFALTRQPKTAFHEALERSSNRLAASIESLTGAPYGPMEMKISFSPVPGRREPIVTTGNLRNTGDILFVYYPTADTAQFGFFHLGSGGPMAEPVKIVPHQEYTLRVDLGSLYPPRYHPRFDHWTDEQFNWLRRELKVMLDGQTVLQARADLYTSTPDGVHVGRNSLAPDVSEPQFAGRIHSVRRLPFPPAPDLESLTGSGPVRMRVRFSPYASENFFPLVATGRSGAGDLIAIQVRPDQTVRFIHDFWGGSPYTTEPAKFEPTDEHLIEIEMASLTPVKELPGTTLTGRLLIRLDGQTIADVERPFNAAKPGECDFGFNAIGASSAQAMFSGTILEVERPGRPNP